MLVPEVIREEMDQPFPGRRDFRVFFLLPEESLDGLAELFVGPLVHDPALWVFAHASRVADNISVLLVDESLDEMRPGVVHEGLAGGLEQALKHRAKLILHKRGHVLSMVGDVVLNDSCEDGTESALVIKAVVLLLDKICIGAFLLQHGGLLEDGLVRLNPALIEEVLVDFLEYLGAVVEDGGGGVGPDDFEFRIELLGLQVHLHDDGEGLAGVSSFVVVPQVGDVVEEVPEHVGGGGQHQQEGEQYKYPHL